MYEFTMSSNQFFPFVQFIAFYTFTVLEVFLKQIL